jgi:hypothetical protein
MANDADNSSGHDEKALPVLEYGVPARGVRRPWLIAALAGAGLLFLLLLLTALLFHARDRPVAVRVSSARIVTPVPMAPGPPANFSMPPRRGGVIVKLERWEGGAIGPGPLSKSPSTQGAKVAARIEVLAYPNSPFQGELMVNGMTTSLKGTVRPMSQPGAFRVQLTVSQNGGNGVSQIASALVAHIDEAMAVGGNSGGAWVVTLKPAERKE